MLDEYSNKFRPTVACFLLLKFEIRSTPPNLCVVPAAYLVWSYSTAGRKGLQLGLLLVPRILIQVLAYITTASFLGWLLFFKDEPSEYRLNQFLKPEDYPTVSLQLPARCISRTDHRAAYAQMHSLRCLDAQPHANLSMPLAVVKPSTSTFMRMLTSSLLLTA